MGAIFERIINWVAELNQDASIHVDIIERIVSKLYSHIDEKESLETSNIEELVATIVKYTVLAPVPIPLNSSMPLIRAVQYEDVVGHGYDNVSRISYIPPGSGITPKIGRMNKKGQSLFYACLGEQDNSIRTILSECRAEADDVFNILHCETKQSNKYEKTKSPPFLYVVPIGINDYFRRDTSDPFGVNQNYRDIYDCIHANALSEISIALKLCDKFLTDVLSRPESGKLYEITSVISEQCLQVDQIDGILYPSTQLFKHPNIALKISSVDEKISYVKASSVRVTRSSQKNYHEVETLGYGVINSGKIKW